MSHVGRKHGASADRVIASAREYLGERAAVRARQIAALPTVDWKGRQLFTVRCRGTSGKGPHDVNVPLALCWHVIDLAHFYCVYHAGDALRGDLSPRISTGAPNAKDREKAGAMEMSHKENTERASKNQASRGAQAPQTVALVARLEGVRNRLLGLGYLQHCNALQDAIAALTVPQAPQTDLRAYVQHKDLCELAEWKQDANIAGDTCTCGLDALLASPVEEPTPPDLSGNWNQHHDAVAPAIKALEQRPFTAPKDIAAELELQGRNMARIAEALANAERVTSGVEEPTPDADEILAIARSLASGVMSVTPRARVQEVARAYLALRAEEEPMAPLVAELLADVRALADDWRNLAHFAAPVRADLWERCARELEKTIAKAERPPSETP